MISALIISFAAYLLGLVCNKLFFNKSPVSRVLLVLSLVLVYLVAFVALMVILSSGWLVGYSDIGKAAGIYASAFVIILYISVNKKHKQEHSIERESDDNEDIQKLTSKADEKLIIDKSLMLSDKDEQAIYELIADELNSQNMIEWLWTKSLSQSNGDLNSAKAIYIRQRYIQIKNDKLSELFESEGISNQGQPVIIMPSDSSKLGHCNDAKSYTKNAAESQNEKLLESNIIVPIVIVVFVVVLLVLINIF